MASKTDSATSPVSKGSKDATNHPPTDILPQEAALRNYASKDCGAKVLFSNEEAENRVST